MQSPRNHPQNIYLTGFMGTGKSTIGQLLSQKTNIPFIDTDNLIQSQSGSSINEIFTQHGEAYFRKLETNTIQKLTVPPAKIVSLGGGAILSVQNRNIFKNGLWIFLHTPFSIIQQRLQNNTTRPLLTQGWDAISQLYQSRLPLYRLAQHVIYCGNSSADAICNTIMKLI